MTDFLARLIARFFPHLARAIRDALARDDGNQAGPTSLGDGMQELRTKALLAGGGICWPGANIAYGTMGYALHALEFEGLMKRAVKFERIGPIESGYVARFMLTQAGRAAQAMLRDDDLAGA